MTQDEIVTETSSANTETLKEIDFSRNKEIVGLRAERHVVPSERSNFRVLSEQPWPGREWAFFLGICASSRSQAVLCPDSLRLRRDSAVLIASALRCKPCCSAADISGSSTRCTPPRPMILGKESVTPNVAL